MDNSTVIRPIGHIYTDFNEKFGIPRQSGLVSGLVGKIIFEPQFRRREALSELDGFSHLWLIWQFSQCDGKWSPTVRPPRLGGNRRVGVFASRSPFRPNSLGLSCVKLEKIDMDCAEAPVIYVSGIDMLDGTPIFDIKPYIPVTDCRNDATDGYTVNTKNYKVKVECDENLLKIIPESKREALLGVLQNDPRPGYDDCGGEYGIMFAGYNVRFSAGSDGLTVTDIKKINL